MLLGIDDTDGPNGGCTTFVLTEVIRAARRSGVDLIGFPRLVRLNPNVPWKTRGNAALAARFGVGRGTPRTVGMFPDGPVVAFPRGEPLAPSVARGLVESAWREVDRLAPTDEPRTDPALVAVPRPMPARLYWTAVRRLVRARELAPLLEEAHATIRHRRRRRGLIGAAAAVAWPGRRATFELVAYRPPGARERHRAVDPGSVSAVEQRYPELFLCSDPRTRRLMVAPHTACPILLGLRATRPDRLPAAFAELRTEPWERWIIFRTNQATGDHLAPRWADDLGPFSAGSVSGRVATPPTSVRGGHVTFGIRDGRGASLSCLVFEPTKTLTGVARQLRLGDRVRVWGGRRRDGAFRLEGIELRGLVLRELPRQAPRCPQCRGRLGSLGRDAPWRCRRCRAVVPRPAASGRTGLRTLAVGEYHPTPSARRHLAPLAMTSRDGHRALTPHPR